MQVPVVVVTSSRSVFQHSAVFFGQYACLVPSLATCFGEGGCVMAGLSMAREKKLLPEEGGDVIVVGESEAGLYFLSWFSAKDGAMPACATRARLEGPAS